MPQNLNCMSMVNKSEVIKMKKYNFENPASKALLAEILTHRDHQPRASFLSSLAAVMVAAISLTMIFGCLATGASQLEPQQVYAEFDADGKILPPEVVPRVHTDTQTETVVVYNDLPPITETLLLSKPVSVEASAAEGSGKAFFDQKKNLFRWEYKGELFTFFVKGNTVFRRSEKTDITTVVYKGYSKTKLFCINDRYLFFSADAYVNYFEYDIYSAYCYRVDLVTGEILRLFITMNENYPNTYETEAFVRFDGTDVVFTNYIVHEDGSYERITDKTEESYNNNAMDDDPWLSLVWYEDDSLYVEDTHGNRYDLGVSAKDIENLGYGISNGVEVLDDNFYISFNSDQDDSNACLCYWGKLTDNGIVGGFVYAKVLDQPEYSIEITANSPREFVDFWYKDEYILCVDYDYEYFLSKYNDETQNFTIDQIPLDYDKLTAATKSGPEYQTLYDCCGEKITLLITYYPSDCFRAATPDSAD